MMPGMAARNSARTTRTKRPLRSVTTWSCRYFDVSRLRRNDSSVPRRRERCRRNRSRTERNSGLASSLTSPDVSILWRTSAISPLNVVPPSTMVLRIRKVPSARRMATRVASTDSRYSPRASNRSGSSARPSTARPRRMAGRSAEAPSGNSPTRSLNRTPSLVAASHWATRLGSDDGRSAARRSAPRGVAASPQTTSTILGELEGLQDGLLHLPSGTEWSRETRSLDGL